MTETMTIATDGGTEFERPRESFTPIEWRTHVLREGRRLLDLHGLDDWSIGIDTKPRNRLGRCSYDRKRIGVSQCFIDLKPTLNDLHDLLLHEIAHVLAPHSHNLVWKRKYAELLSQHFVAYKAAKYLSEDRYCRNQVQRLLRDVNAELPSTRLEIACPTCGTSGGQVVLSDYYWHWLKFKCGHRHTMHIDTEPFGIRMEPGHDGKGF
jgi:hypothetical protein